ncbi:MAG: NUDIX hydrolase [Chloroflexi bacterium]|nr:MAG: NUDIX hydrolase [Chloroflexota bacterium]MBL1193363.1 NUDIX hydrolase [Chloroflexota bacterium]NOH10655.1 NUDIX hydrolase [Chloroflexota bacterium]
MKETTVIEAAGGLLWKDAPEGKQIAIIHRPRYDDWTLPKGKLEQGETWEQAALREVSEETGYKVKLGEFAGSTTYTIGQNPKIVLYWHMTIAEENDFVVNEEVDELQWMFAENALRKLDYADERSLLAQQKV